MRYPVLMNQTRVKAAEGSFIRGFVATACVSAFQDTASPQSSAQLKRILRHALQGGTALAAGTHAAAAVKEGNYLGAALAAATGAVGVLALERLLQTQPVATNGEPTHGQEA